MADKIEIEIALKNAQTALNDLKKISAGVEDVGENAQASLNDLKKISSGIEDVGEEAKKSESKITKFVQRITQFGQRITQFGQRIKQNFLTIAAGITASMVTIKKAFDITAGAARFEQSMDAAAKQFGVDADFILKKLREVSGGTISNADLITAANKAMALNVTKDIGQMADLMEIARVRGRAMGIDTTFAFDSIVTGIGRGSPLILDNLGIITKGWDDEAKKAGVAMDANFILNKVLADGAELLNKTGPLTLTAAERFQTFGVAVSNAKDNLGKALIPVFETLLPIVEDLITGFTNLPKSLKVIGFAIAALIPAVIALNAAFGPVGLAITGLATIAAIMFGKFKKDSKEAAEESTAEWDKATKKFEDYTDRLNENWKKYFDFSKRTNKELIKDRQGLINQLAIANTKEAKMIDGKLLYVEKNNEAEKKFIKARIKAIENEAIQRSSINKKSGDDELELKKDQLADLAKAEKEAEEERLKSLEAEAAQRNTLFDEAKAAEMAFIKSSNDEAKESYKGLQGVLGEIGGTEGELAQSIAKMIELGEVAEIAGTKAEEAGTKAEMAWSKVLGVIGLVKAALNEISFIFEFMSDVAGDEGNSKAERTLLSISKILSAMATGSPWKIIQAIRDVVLGGREANKEADIAAYEAQGMTREQAENRAKNASGPSQAIQGRNESVAKTSIVAALTGGLSTVDLLIEKIKKRANGGPVMANQPYMVGERGPELMVPSQSGTVLPNGQGMGDTFNVGTIVTNSSQDFFRQLQNYKRQYGSV